jgi:transcription initiation factor TFIID subunit 5
MILASGGADDCVKLWDVSKLDDDRPNITEQLLGSFSTKSTPVYSLHFTGKNLLLAAGPFINN